MDDALVCLYQNGERVRPSNGYPIRLLLPGFEGNTNVKCASTAASWGSIRPLALLLSSATNNSLQKVQDDSRLDPRA
jgi:hypothetical protein